VGHPLIDEEGAGLSIVREFEKIFVDPAENFLRKGRPGNFTLQK
jgi:hypothetical protein